MTKVSGKSVGTNPFRGTTVTGTANEYPVVGKGFRVIAESIDPKLDFRLVFTSDVKSVVILDADLIRATTENSVYEIEFLKEDA